MVYVAEYIVAIDVTWVRFPADAEGQDAMPVKTNRNMNSAADIVITEVAPRDNPERRGGWGGGAAALFKLCGFPVPCLRTQRWGEPHIAVVRVTLSDPLLL